MDLAEVIVKEYVVIRTPFVFLLYILTGRKIMALYEQFELAQALTCVRARTRTIKRLRKEALMEHERNQEELWWIHYHNAGWRELSSIPDKE